MPLFRRIFLSIALLLIPVRAYCGTVALNSVSADATAAGINGNFTQIANVINGNVEGSQDGTSVTNIKADSVYEINMANDANPRVFANELLNIGSDSFSSGTLTQGAVVESGCVPATDTDLTSDVSACTAYVNGYRVSKSAESVTYTASRDTYLDLTQTGVYTKVEVANGATQPSVTANSIRLATVVTNGTQITSVTNLFTTRIPGLIIPANYRNGLVVSRDSTTTMTVDVGAVEINNTMVSKTSMTTLTISTASDWAGGTSLRAADTFGFVGLDASGNLKMHTTAPTHSNYAVSTTAGKKRYATWSSTVYRILGWFYMDGAASALVEVASNMKEGDVANIVVSNDASFATFAGTTYATNNRLGGVRFYSSGNQVKHYFSISGDSSAAFNRFDTVIFSGAAQIAGSEKSDNIGGVGVNKTLTNVFVEADLSTPSQATRTYSIGAKVNSDIFQRKKVTYFVEEA